MLTRHAVVYVTLLYGVIAGLQHPDAAAAAAADRASRRARHRYSHRCRRRSRRRSPASGESPSNGRQQHALRCAGDVVPRLSRCGGRLRLATKVVRRGGFCRPVGGGGSGGGRHVAHRRPTKAPRARCAAECREYHTAVSVVRIPPPLSLAVRLSARSTVVSVSSHRNTHTRPRVDDSDFYRPPMFEIIIITTT